MLSGGKIDAREEEALKLLSQRGGEIPPTC
jgi:hypothetical protein